MKKSKVAKEYFLGGFNCCQSVLVAFAEDYGLTKELGLKLGSSFGGGVGDRGKLCGAVMGAFMVLGLKHGRVDVNDMQSKYDNYTAMNEFETLFRDKFKEIECSCLIGCDMSNINEKQQAKSQGILGEKCPVFVEMAAEILDSNF
jgi:C_GCAxxG_C_C family probable redox protein